MQNLKSPIIKLVIHQWRLLVKVRELQSFDNIHVGDTQKSYREKNWKGETMGEGDEDLVHNVGVSEVDNNVGS